MKLFWRKPKFTEPEGDGDASELSLIRDSRGNWVNEATGGIYAYANEPEDGDADADA